VVFAFAMVTIRVLTSVKQQGRERDWTAQKGRRVLELEVGLESNGIILLCCLYGLPEKNVVHK
jgi:hypothetical protein